jgi:hypothetical protein
MRRLGRRAIILAMTAPATSTRVLLLEERRAQAADASSAPIRRYRLARLRFEPRAAAPASRFDHLKRVFD